MDLQARRYQMSQGALSVFLFLMPTGKCQTASPLTIPTAPVIISTSVQQSPTPLPKGLQLVAVTVCSAAPRPMVTAPQIFNALQQVGIGYQAPSLYPGLISRSVSRTPVSLLLSTVKYTATGVSIGS